MPHCGAGGQNLGNCQNVFFLYINLKKNIQIETVVIDKAQSCDIGLSKSHEVKISMTYIS